MNRIYLALRICAVCVCCFLFSVSAKAQEKSPLRVGVAGVSHAHLHEVIIRLERGDFQIVGVSEKDPRILKENGLRGKVADSLFFADIHEMLEKTKPEAVVAYGSIYDHLEVVKACAPRHIHVMVEKPLAVNMEHANQMADLARENDILLLTNYETTWYPTNHKAYKLVNDEKALGPVHRINVFDGHQGPFEIGCGRDFTDWLTDPVLNGGGAVIDFGCYGANLATWLLKGEKPVRVYGVLQQCKPDKYPKVDDDATIIVEYPHTVVQIMASWNWPLNRKDMHIYGKDGYIYQDNATDMRVNIKGKDVKTDVPALQPPYNDSFYYLKAAVRGEIEVAPYDLSALENNLMVVRILEAAIRSARSGQPVVL